MSEYGGKCISCGGYGEYMHKDGGYVCENCVGRYFTCPDCGMVFDQDDYANADAGDGFCVKCSPNH